MTRCISGIVILACFAVPVSAADDAPSLFQRGVQHYNKGEFDQAITAFSDAIQMQPADASYRSWRGVCYGQKKEWEKSIADHTEAIRLAPKEPLHLCNRTSAYISTASYDKSIEDATSAIALDPKCARAYHLRSLAYSSKAQADWKEATRLDPKLVQRAEGEATDGGKPKSKAYQEGYANGSKFAAVLLEAEENGGGTHMTEEKFIKEYSNPVLDELQTGIKSIPYPVSQPTERQDWVQGHKDGMLDTYKPIKKK
jgi:tetratricopeptide (TPR) repeat protein